MSIFAEATLWGTLGWLALSGLVLVWAATGLTRAAEQIANSTGIGQLWLGSVLLAAATSLPELVTDVTAVRLGASDLAAGDLFGSSMANMMILALLLLLRRPDTVTWRFGNELTRTAGLAWVLTALAAMAVLLRPQSSWFGFAPMSLLLVTIYLLWTRSGFIHDRAASTEEAKPSHTLPSGDSWHRAGWGFCVAALVIVLSAPLFAAASHRLAELSGLGDTFVGTAIVGLSTSLPELVVSLAALRLGASGLAVGNLFGSNAFNMLIFAGMDFADRRPIFAALDPTHALSALAAIGLMAVGLSAVLRPPRSRLALFEPSGLTLMLAYWAIMVTLLIHTSGTG